MLHELAAMERKRFRIASHRPAQNHAAVVWAPVAPSGVSNAGGGLEGTAAHPTPLSRC